MDESRHSRIKGFDGLRALAFLFVFASHRFPTPKTEALGTTGVWLFFVLSGYLIIGNLAALRGQVEMGRLTLSRALADFYLRRSARIFPAYYCFLAVATVLAAFGFLDLGPLGRKVSNWLYLSNVYIGMRGWTGDLGHLWSLAIEEQFYILFAPLALLTPRVRLTWLCAAVVALSIAASAAYKATGVLWYVFDVSSLINFGLLGWGGLTVLALDATLSDRLRTDAAIGAVMVAIVALPVIFAEPDNAPWLEYGRPVAVLMGLLLAQIARRQDGLVVRVLDAAPLRWMGMVSYGAYLWHLLIITVLSHVGVYERLVAPGPGAVIELALTLVISGLSYRYLEAPIRTAARRWSTLNASGRLGREPDALARGDGLP